MKRRTSLLALVAAGIIAAGVSAIPAHSALAAPTPCPTSTTGAPGQGGSGSPNPNGNSGDCAVTGTIQIPTVFAIADDFSSFTVGLNGQPSTPMYVGDVLVESNSATGGYSVTEILAGGSFTNGTHTISAASVEAGTYEQVAGTYQTASSYAPLSRGTDQNFFVSQIPGNPPNGTGFPAAGTTGGVSENCQSPASGWDCYGVAAYWLTGGIAYSPGTYTGTVDFDLWNN